MNGFIAHTAADPHCPLPIRRESSYQRKLESTTLPLGQANKQDKKA